MCFIVLAHYSWHGGSYSEANSTNKIIASFLAIGGKLGVNCFVMIGAWFMSDKDFKSKKIFNLVVNTILYSLVLYIVLNYQALSIKQILESIFSIFFNKYWFVTAYIGVMLLSPFLNKIINEFEKQEYRNLCIILFVMVGGIPSILSTAFPYSNDILWFVTLYLITAYMKKYPVKKLNSNALNLILLITSLLFIMVTEIVLDNIVPGKRGYYLYYGYIFPVFLCSVALFMLFKNINIGSKKTINWIANSMLGVYLFHEHPSVRKVLWDSLQCSEYFNSPLYIVHAFASMILVMIIGIALDKAYKLIERVIGKIYA